MKIVNKRGLHDYHILDSIEAGIKLYGSEVKSIRLGRVDLGQSFVRILNGEAYVINMNIPAYENAPKKDYQPARNRKLLLHRKQISTLIGRVTSGVTLIPVAIYDKNNLLKVQVGIAKSKKQVDKRKIIKERDHMRRVEQELRGKE